MSHNPRVANAGQVPRILDRLLAERKITREHYDATVLHWRRDGGAIEEALLDATPLGELDVLKALAAVYRTRFVTTEKLSKADITGPLLAMVPRKLAERAQVLPVMYDASNATLSIVTADPDNVSVLEEVKVVSRAREVKGFVGRPRAIKAAIAKIYGGDPSLFAALDRESSDAYSPHMIDVFGQQQRPQKQAERPRAISAPPLSSGTSSPFIHQVRPNQLTPAAPIAPPPPPVLTLPDLAPPPPLATPLPAPTPLVRPPTERPHGIASESWLESLNVLVSLLENNRPDLRGHSSHVARLTRKLCERMGIAQRDIEFIVAAAYLHDLGKASSYHLTSLNVAEYDGHKIAAKKSVLTPSRLMEGAKLAEATAKSLNHMYERFDGKGFPDGIAGKDIPLGSRVLAITDTYADLTQNPRNPFRKALRPTEASDVLAKFKGQIFDNNLVDIFKHVVSGDDLKAKLLANRRAALLVDADPEETTVLELRMIEQGFEVKIVRQADQAEKAIAESEFEMVVSEVELQPFDGFALLEKVRATNNGRDLAWVFLSNRADREDINRGFELGAVDYVEKPVKAEILVAKLRKLVEQGAAATKQASRGVSGSLEEMSLPDMVQILAQGRKTGALKIRSGNDTGELHFVTGEIYDAMWGKNRGENAVYAMLKLRTGDFSLDPNYKCEKRAIQMSAEGLLLEGMRRLDEDSRVEPAPK